MANPYDFSGFDEGFARGLDIIWRMQDRKFAEQDRERRIKREDQEFIAQQEERGLRKRQLEHEISIAPTPEEAAAARKANLRSSAASASRDEESVTSVRKQRKALTAEYRLDRLESRGPHIASLIRDPEWLESGGKIYDFFNVGSWDQQETQESFTKKGIKWFNQTYKPDLDKGIGMTIRSSTAKEQDVPEGATITDKKIKSFHVDEEYGVIVLELEVEVEKDGKKYYYNAPVTKNRTDAPDDEIIQIPIERFEEIARAGGTLRKAAKDIEQQGGTADDIAAYIEANTAGLRARTKGKTPSKIQEIERIADARFGGDYAKAEAYISNRITPSAVASLAKVALDNDVTGTLTLEQATEQAKIALLKQVLQEEETPGQTPTGIKIGRFSVEVEKSGMSE